MNVTYVSMYRLFSAEDLLSYFGNKSDVIGAFVSCKYLCVLS